VTADVARFDETSRLRTREARPRAQTADCRCGCSHADQCGASPSIKRAPDARPCRSARSDPTDQPTHAALRVSECGTVRSTVLNVSRNTKMTQGPWIWPLGTLGGLHPHRSVARPGQAVRRRCSSDRLGHPLRHQEPRTPVAELRNHYHRRSVSTAERAVDAHEPVVGCGGVQVPLWPPL